MVVKVILNVGLEKSITGEDRFAAVFVEEKGVVLFPQQLQLGFYIFKQPLILISQQQLLDGDQVLHALSDVVLDFVDEITLQYVLLLPQSAQLGARLVLARRLEGVSLAHGQWQGVVVGAAFQTQLLILGLGFAALAQ